MTVVELSEPKAASRLPGSEPWLAFGRARRWLFLIILFLIVTTSYVDRGIFPILIEPLKAEFGLSDTMIGILGGLPFTLCYVLSTIPFARVADRSNRKTVLLLALTVWSSMTALCGAATSLVMLFIGRMGVGVGEGGASPPTNSLAMAYFPPRDRGKAFAVLVAAGTAGSFIALSAGGWIAAHYGWRAAFFAMAALSVPIGLAAKLILVEPRARGVDIASAGQASLLADLKTLISKPSFARTIVAVAAYSLFAWGPLAFVPVYLMRLLGLDLAAAGTSSGLAIAGGSLIGAVVGGIVIDTLQRRDIRWLLWLPAAGMILVAPLALMAFTTDSVALALILVALIYGILSALMPSLNAAVQYVCGETRRATASAVFMIAINLVGATLGPLGTGMISDLLAPSHGTSSLRYAMIAMSLPLIPAAVMFLLSARAIKRDLE